MPGGSLGNSYTSLEHVYRGTTLPQPTLGRGPGIVESIKKVFAKSGSEKGGSDPLIECWDGVCDSPVIVPRQDTLSDNSIPNIESSQMPTSVAEETALLGTVATDSMDDIELKGIQLQFPSSRRISNEGGAVETRVRTDCGELVVAVQGDRQKPAIITYHDLGLNYISAFQAFFNYVDMRALLENFCVYHVNMPGQEEGAATFPEQYVYPSMDEMARQISFVLSHFCIKSFIGFGVGAGANVLARYAQTNSDRVNALVLINCVSTQAGWIEWGYQKVNARHLRSKGMTQGVLDYLMWHHFGRNTEERNHDLVQMYRLYFARSVNPTNLSLLVDSYVRRSDLNISRDSNTLKVPVLNITGSMSPHAEDTVTLNGRLDPTKATWMKISDCGMVLEEQPGKVSEAFRLFLQGEGYVAPLSPTKITEFRRNSIKEWQRTLKRARHIFTKRTGSTKNSDSKQGFKPSKSLSSSKSSGSYKTQGAAKKTPPVAETYKDNIVYETAGVTKKTQGSDKAHNTIIHITENPISDAVAC